MFEIKNFINGKWVPAASGIVSEDRNPATGEIIATVPRSSKEDVDTAVHAAAEAFKSWRLVPAPKRGEFLYRVGQMLMDRKEELARAMTREMGKVIIEARGDVQEGIDMAFYMAGEGRRNFGFTTHSELPNKFAMAVKEPLGVAALITPWNFPLAIPTWKMFPAIVTGNTVVFKPASDTPYLAHELVRILEECGLPAGVVNLVYGSGQEVGETLATHPGVQLVSFTGSNDVGRRVNVVGAESFKRVSLELGGKNAITVMDDADLELAVEGILFGAYGTAGQRCTATSRVLVHKSVHGELRDRLVARVEKLRLGNGLDESVDVGPVINAGALRRIHEYVDIGQREGAKLVLGGRVAAENELAQGSFYAPTLFDDVLPEHRIAFEEIFGPVLSLIEIDSLQQAIEINNSVTYGLSSAIYTRDVNQVFTAIRDLASGIVYINAGTTGAEIHLPFGGMRGTGNGHREAGVAAMEFFTEWKAVYVDFSGKLQRAQIDA